MIASLKGKLLYKDEKLAIIDTGGVGWEVNIDKFTFTDLPEINKKVFLFIKTVVRADVIELFGFLNMASKETFLALTSVSRIGPRSALTILSGIQPQELAQAIVNKDLAKLTKISGIGAKTAERMALELKDKAYNLISLNKEIITNDVESQLMPSQNEDLLMALMNLGYTRHEAEKGITFAYQNVDSNEFELSQLIKLALQALKK